MKRKIALFLVTALTISAFTTGEGQTVLAQDVDGETFTAESYQDASVAIYTVADLAAYSGGEMRGNYVLMNDIDLSAYAGGVSGITVFGSFNGNGHIIYADRPRRSGREPGQPSR